MTALSIGFGKSGPFSGRSSSARRISGSANEVKVANVATLRDMLKPRYAKGGERKTPDGADVSKVMLGLDDPGKSLSAETPGILVIAKPLTRVRLIGMHFDTNKCFLREPAMHGIRKVVSVYKANPTGKLLIVGHTDTVDTDAYNLDLSVERAEAVKAYLKDDVAAWEAWFGDGKPAKKRWGDAEIGHMIDALPCEKSVKDFQQWSNDTRGTGLKVDGIAGPKTRKALVEAYMALDGTTLPKSIDAVVHGCGEFFPRKDEKDEYGKDDVEAEENRRVELFCFDDEIQPPVPGKKATKGEPEYPNWSKQVTTEVDFAANTTSFRVRFHDHNAHPMSNVNYRTMVSGTWSSQRLSNDGWAAVVVPIGINEVPVEWNYDEASEDYMYRATLRLAPTAEVNDVTSQRAHLNNLGFPNPTEVDFEEAARRFQQAYSLAELGLRDGRLPPSSITRIRAIIASECNAQRS